MIAEAMIDEVVGIKSDHSFDISVNKWRTTIVVQAGRNEVMVSLITDSPYPPLRDFKTALKLLAENI